MGRKNRAFTLVELMIVLAIIALLATIALIYLRSQVLKGNDARRKADINRIKVAAEEYEKDHNCYPPPNLVLCNTPIGSPGTGLRPYLETIPCDPTTRISYVYDYQSGACPSWFRIFTKLEYTQDPAATPGIGPGSAYNYYSGSANAPVPVSTEPSLTPTPDGSGSGGTNYWGCINRVCVPIDVTSPGNPVCNPSYTIRGCNNDCNPPDQNDHTFDCVPI